MSDKEIKKTDTPETPKTSKDVKKELKTMKKGIMNDFVQFVKKVKAFKKISSSNFEEGEKQAKALIEDVKLFKSKYSKIDVKIETQMDRLNDGLKLYLLNIDSIKTFNDKWSSKK